jgi:hypothetical protein
MCESNVHTDLNKNHIESVNKFINLIFHCHEEIDL